jgi:dipeptidyl aminopeptidase/acylaminoacyl peptidase
VTHASLWALDQFGPTTDASQYWLKEMTEEMALENSPHLHVEKISTPMLVIHGDKDYRVPIGEGLRLWYELLSKSQLAADQDGRTPHRFLYFPDENHWVLQPQHAKVWYGVGPQRPGPGPAGAVRAGAVVTFASCREPPGTPTRIAL